MAGRVLAVASQAGSAAAALAQKFAKENRAEADVVVLSGKLLPPGAWASAWFAPGAEARHAGELLPATADTYDVFVFDEARPGKEMAGRLGVRLGLPVVAEVVSLRAGGDGLQVVRNTGGGARTATLAAPGGRAVLVASSTVGSPGGSARSATPPGKIDVNSTNALIELIGTAQLGPGEMEVTEADVVVAGGRGAGGREGFGALEELAGLLGGTVGASRVAVDAGWAPYSRQIGLTGKTVAPRLYLACGISGAPHHVLGMRNSSLIVAINMDKQAPIFQVAHCAIVAKVEEVVPELIGELRKRPPKAAERLEVMAG